MKATKISVLAMAAAALLCSCVSKPVKGTGFDMEVNKPQIIDYKGQSFGADIPGWVIDATNNAEKNVKKGLNITDEKIWILQNVGQDLDQLTLWTDQIDGRAQIASGIEQSVGDIIIASMESNQDVDETTKQKYVKDFSTRVTNITLNGLEKEADYWTKTRTLKQGLKKAKSEADYEYKYTYIVVFGMEQKLYEKQVKAAMEDVNENDDQATKLRDMITAKLMEEASVYVVSEVEE